MRTNLFVLLAVGVLMLTAGCSRAVKDDAHTHDESLQLTAYNELFEVYAELTPPVAGDTCEIVAHFTWLDGFKPLESGAIKASLGAARQTLEAPTRVGIYKFHLVPAATGEACITFDIATPDGSSRLVTPTFTVSAADPSLAIARVENDAAQSAASLARSRTLPRWSIGNMGEFVEGNTFQGVTFGLSLPLWGNIGRVRQARLNAEAIQSHGDAIRQQLSSRYRSLLQEAQRLVALIAQMDSTLPTADADLLHRAFFAGELSLTDYLLEQSLSSSALARRLAAQRDLHQLLAEMYSFKL